MDQQNEYSGKSDRLYKVNVLDRSVSILEVLAQFGPSLTQAEIAKLTNLHVSTCMRLLMSLRQHGLVGKDEDSGRYRLGYRLIALAEISRGGSGLVDVARSVMRDLCNAFNETVVISVVSSDYRVDLEQYVGRQSIRRVVTLGVEKPLYAGAASRVLLSGFSDVDLDSYLQRVRLEKLAPLTITSREELKASLQEIREKGYAEASQEQYEDSGMGIVAPVKGVRGEVVAALGVSIPRFRYKPSLRDKILPAIIKGAADVTRNLGGR